ncbi:MAG: hypothetical protein AB8F74_17680 [Saprospiraceae bacterium]
MFKHSLFGLLCILLFSTCGKDNNFLFTMDYDLEFIIQPGLSPFGGIHGVSIKDIPTQFQNYLASNGITEDQVVKISSGSARISSLLPSSGYGFIQTAEIYITNPMDLADTRLVFERLEVPQNTGQQLELLGSLIDSKRFLSEEAFNLNFEIRVRQTSPELIRTRLEVEFRVEIDE